MATETNYAFNTCTVVVDSTDGEHSEYLLNKNEICGFCANRCEDNSYFMEVHVHGSKLCFYLSSEEQYIEFRNWCMQP